MFTQSMFTFSFIFTLLLLSHRLHDLHIIVGCYFVLSCIACTLYIQICVCKYYNSSRYSGSLQPAFHAISTIYLPVPPCKLWELMHFSLYFLCTLSSVTYVCLFFCSFELTHFVYCQILVKSSYPLRWRYRCKLSYGLYLIYILDNG